MLFDKNSYPLGVRTAEEGAEGGLSASRWAALRQSGAHWDEGPSFYDLIRGFGKENPSLRSSIKKAIGALLRTRGAETPSYGRFCGSALNSSLLASRRDFLAQGVSLVVVNYRKPLTLLNSLRSWNSSGYVALQPQVTPPHCTLPENRLLGMVRERIIILSDPLPSEIAMSLEYGFKVWAASTSMRTHSPPR